CYALGNITISGNSYVGGLVGRQYANITNAYSIGKINGSYGSYVGPLIGLSSSGTYSNIYWDMTNSGISSSSYGVGKTTTEMHTQSTYIGFDFTTIWSISAGNYPTLR
ncbi:MAG: GLUG motif-containing protein, partial [Ignavibacteriales bacterium]